MTEPVGKIETHSSPNPEPEKLIRTLQEWLDMNPSALEQEAVIGSPDNPIVRPRTKNFIEGPEKSFKTTFALRLAAGISCGTTVFPLMPVPRAHSVLYLHGELSDLDIRDRSIAASTDLKGPFDNLQQGRVLRAHLIDKQGQKELLDLIRTYRTENVVLDPWQSFISGYDENSFQQMSQATAFCDRLIEEFGITLWIVIHLGKDPSRGARGHSTLAGWRDTRIQLKREKRSLLISVDVEPRSAAPLEIFNLEFDGSGNRTLWPTNAKTRSGRTGQIRDFVESKGGAVTRDALAGFLASCGAKKDAARKAIERAEKVGAIKMAGGFITLPSANFVENKSEQPF